MALLKIGDCQGRAGDRAGGLAQYEQGLALVDPLAGAEPSVAAYARLRGFLLNRIAIGRAETGDLQGALEAAQAALAQAETLAHGDPADRQIRGDVAAILSTEGAVRLQLGRQAPAQAALARSVAMYDDMASAGAVSIDQRSEHGVALRRAGDADLLAGKRDRARVHYEAAVRLLEAAPRDLEYEAELAAVYMRLGEIMLTPHPAGPVRETARAWLDKSYATWRSAAARGVRPGRLLPGGASTVEALIRATDAAPAAR